MFNTIRALTMTSALLATGCVQPHEANEQDPAESGEGEASSPKTPAPKDPAQPVQEEPLGSPYARDARGYPLSEHAHSFASIVTDGGRACLIDEHAQLFCFDVHRQDVEDAYPEGVEMAELPEGPLYPLAQGVDAVILTDGEPCIIQGSSVSCFARHAYDIDQPDGWRQVVVMDPPPTALMGGNDHTEGVVCVSDASGVQSCFDQNPWTDDAGYARPHEQFNELVSKYDPLDLRNLFSGRIMSLCGRTTQGEVRCEQSTGDWTAEHVITIPLSAQGHAHVQVRSEWQEVAALDVQGHVDLMNFSAFYESSYARVATLQGPYTELLSASCGVRKDGDVACWTRQGCRGGQIGAIERTVLTQPQHVSVSEFTWCAVMQHGEVECGSI